MADKSKSDAFQYVIVGSGVAGSTVAKCILEKNDHASVLMLEAGPKVETRNRRYWWDYIVLNEQTGNGSRPRNRKPYDFTYDQPGDFYSVGKTGFYVPGSRVIAYGGSTLHWGGWSLRFKPEDFFLHTNTGEGGDWPFDYDHLEPFYSRAEEYLSVCGDDKESWNSYRAPGGKAMRSISYPRPPYDWTEADGEMIQAFERQGIEPGKMPLARYRRCMTTGTCKYCPIGARFSGDAVLDELQSGRSPSSARPSYPNFELRWNAPALRVLVDSASRRRMIGVEYLDSITGITHRAMVGKGGRVIVCSGAYESPKLLMISRNKQWPNGIGNEYDLLGRYVVTHSILKVLGTLDRNSERWVQEYDFPTLMSRTWDTEQSQPKNKIFLFKNRKLPNFDVAGHMIEGKSRPEIDQIQTASRTTELQAFMEEKGRFENRLTLARGRTRFGLPKMRIAFTRPDSTTKNGNDWLNKMQQVILDMGYRIADPSNDRRIDDPGGHHTTGTCRMGKSADQGITDSDLRVFGTDNLYVCSNAVFPSGSAVNPTLTLTALALRLGDHL